MVTDKKLTFSILSKNKKLILINNMKELDQAFKSKQQIIALGKKPKVIKSGNNGGGNRKPPKYFTDFANKQETTNNKIFNALDQILIRLDKIDEFINAQLKFNEEQRKFNIETNKKFEYIFNVFNRNNLH